MRRAGLFSSSPSPPSTNFLQGFDTTIAFQYANGADDGSLSLNYPSQVPPLPARGFLCAIAITGKQAFTPASQPVGVPIHFAPRLWKSVLRLQK